MRKLQDSLITHPNLRSSLDLAELAAKLDYEVQLHYEHLEFISPLARHVESHCTSNAIKLDVILATNFARRERITALSAALQKLPRNRIGVENCCWLFRI
jgi:hypothetical protein